MNKKRTSWPCPKCIVSALMVRSRLAASALKRAVHARCNQNSFQSGRRSRASSTRKFCTHSLETLSNTLFRTHQPNSQHSITHSLTHGSTKIVARPSAFPDSRPIPPPPFTIPFGPPFIGVLYADTRECLGGSSARPIRRPIREEAASRQRPTFAFGCALQPRHFRTNAIGPPSSGYSALASINQSSSVLCFGEFNERSSTPGGEERLCC